MRNYMIRRVGHSIFIVLALMAMLFFAINILGDPVELLVGDDAIQEVVDALRKKHGLDRPLYVRFGEFYVNFLTGDFDRSIRLHLPARTLIFDRLPNTVVLAIAAWSIGMLGVPIGILAARRPRGMIDSILNVLERVCVIESIQLDQRAGSALRVGPASDPEFILCCDSRGQQPSRTKQRLVELGRPSG